VGGGGTRIRPLGRIDGERYSLPLRFGIYFRDQDITKEKEVKKE